MKWFALLPLFIIPVLLPAQKRILDYQEIHRWRKIEQTQFSRDGRWVSYVLAPHTEGDNRLHLWNAATEKEQVFERASNPAFTADSRFLVFRIKPAFDTLKALRRNKVKEEDLPNDTLAIYRLADGRLERIPDMKSVSVPDDWSGLVACLLEPQQAGKDKDKEDKPASADSTAVKPKPDPKKLKKENKDNGSKLILIDLLADRRDTVLFVRDLTLAKKAPALLLYTTGVDTIADARGTLPADLPGVYHYDAAIRTLRPLWRGAGKFEQLALHDNGRMAAFLADTDTSKARVRPWQLCLWTGLDSARAIAGANSAFLPSDPDGRWILSEHARPVFSENGNKLYFGIAPPPILQDTALLPEEIVNVEVWTWKDPRLYTEQNKRAAADRKRSYPVVFHLAGPEGFVLLGHPELPDWRFQQQRDADLALAWSETPYLIERQWEGESRKDLYAVDLKTGAQMPVAQGLRGSPQLSPAARYIAWWNDAESAWFAWNAQSSATYQLTDNENFPFYNEKNDVPDYPSPYGVAGWLDADEALLVYDRFDIWRVDPSGTHPPKRLTRGRENNTVFRYLRLDPEERSIAPDAKLFLHLFNEKTKSEGYAWLDLKTGAVTVWYQGDFAFTKNVLKAKDADALVFSCQSFQTYPDLLYSAFDPGKRNSNPAFRRISQANPQQAEYYWGTIELVRWTSLDGEPLEGLLVKPEDFDSTRQYPMLVNFYERLSDGLYQHRAPDAHRSTLNHTIYASRGYLVFMPDIHYSTGYPGESAYNAIMSGVQHLIGKGFVDRERIGLQGHSWGGYQAAYLVTRTDLFRCAEAGAPVANMTSAYGGIRWESGLNRQFQYERQQSRIGGSLWEYPLRYIDNSPLFYLDKVNTPLLILHNDEDGAVPWYQGIELFTGLRRLGKPCWMLNYNGEPHWPVKLQNRIDFQTRMLQFFDHYLMEGPLPSWMDKGVSPLEKGIRQGLDPK